MDEAVAACTVTNCDPECDFKLCTSCVEVVCRDSGAPSIRLLNAHGTTPPSHSNHTLKLTFISLNDHASDTGKEKAIEYDGFGHMFDEDGDVDDDEDDEDDVVYGGGELDDEPHAVKRQRSVSLLPQDRQKRTLDGDEQLDEYHLFEAANEHDNADDDDDDEDAMMFGGLSPSRYIHEQSSHTHHAVIVEKPISPHGYINPYLTDYGLSSYPVIWDDVRGVGRRNDYGRWVMKSNGFTYFSVALRGRRNQHTPDGAYHVMNGKIIKGSAWKRIPDEEFDPIDRKAETVEPTHDSTDTSGPVSIHHCDEILNETAWLEEADQRGRASESDIMIGAWKLRQRMMATEWDSFYQRLVKDGVMTRALYDEWQRVAQLFSSIYAKLLPSQHVTQAPAIKLPCHPHPLKLYEKRYQGEYVCNLCCKNGGEWGYACDECLFDVHPGCVAPFLPSSFSDLDMASLVATAAGTIADVMPPQQDEHHPLYHPHPLQIYEKGKDHEGGNACQVCHHIADEKLAYSYACRVCGFEVHLACYMCPSLAILWRESLQYDPETEKKNGWKDSQWFESVVTRMEEDAQAIYRVAWAIRRLSQHVFIDDIRRTFKQTKFKHGDKHVGYRCSYARCMQREDGAASPSWDQAAVFHCKECETNLCALCAAKLHLASPSMLMTADHDTIDAMIQLTTSAIVNWPNALVDMDRDASGKTQLIRSITAKDLPTVSSLLRSGAGVHIRDTTGRNAIQAAVECGDVAILEMVLGFLPYHYRSARIAAGIASEAEEHDDSDGLPMDETTLNDDREIIEDEHEGEEEGEYDYRYSTAPQVLSPLCLAARAGHLAMVELLLAADSPVAGALWIAADNRHVNVARSLLDAPDVFADSPCTTGQSEYSDGNPTALHLACTHGDLDMAKLLIDNGASVLETHHHDQDSCLSLAFCTQVECPDLVRAVLQQACIEASNVRRLGKGKTAMATTTKHREDSHADDSTDEDDKAKAKKVEPDDKSDFMTPTQLIESRSWEWLTYVLEQMVQSSHPCSSHLAILLHHRPSYFQDWLVSFKMPKLVVRASAYGHRACVEVVIRHLAKFFYLAKTSRTRKITTGGASTGTGTAAQKQSTRNIRRFIYDSTVSEYLDFQQIGKHPSTVALLSAPAVVSAFSGDTALVRFALDHMVKLPTLDPDDSLRTREKQIPVSIDDVYHCTQIDPLNGYSVMHAACASAQCSHRLVKWLLTRGASSLRPATPHAATNAATALLAQPADKVGTKLDIPSSAPTASSSSSSISPSAAFPLSLPGRTLDVDAPTPLFLLRHNQQLPSQTKLAICRTLARHVANLYQRIQNWKDRHGNDNGNMITTMPTKLVRQASRRKVVKADGDGDGAEEEEEHKWDLDREGDLDMKSIPELEHLIALFVRQLTSSREFMSVAWEEIACLFSFFSRDCILAASAEALYAALTHPYMLKHPHAQTQLLFHDQISPQVIMSLLPLLARHHQKNLILQLARDERSQYLHMNPTIADQYSLLTACAIASYSKGVMGVIQCKPIPALANSADILARAAIQIVIQEWMGTKHEAKKDAKMFMEQLYLQYTNTKDNKAKGKANDKGISLQPSSASLSLIPSSSSPVQLKSLTLSTLSIVRHEYDRLVAAALGHDSVNLLDHTEYANASGSGSGGFNTYVRFHMDAAAMGTGMGAGTGTGVGMDLSQCQTRCSAPCWGVLTYYCQTCTRFYCDICGAAAHIVKDHKSGRVSIDKLKEIYLNRFQALDAAMQAATKPSHRTIAVGDAPAIANVNANTHGNGNGNGTGMSVSSSVSAPHLYQSELDRQRSERYIVLCHLLSAEGRFRFDDLLHAVKNWSFDALNFRTNIELAQNHDGQQADNGDYTGQGMSVEDGKAIVLSARKPQPSASSSSQSSAASSTYTLASGRSLLHLVAIHQDASLIHSILCMLIHPTPNINIPVMQRPWKYFQLIIWKGRRRRMEEKDGKGQVATQGHQRDSQTGEEGNVSELGIAGIRLDHHDTVLPISNVHYATLPNRPLSDLDNSSACMRSGQSLICFSLPYPCVVTHYELLYYANQPWHTRPRRWQLSATNDDEDAPTRRWHVLHRTTSFAARGMTRRGGGGGAGGHGRFKVLREGEEAAATAAGSNKLVSLVGGMSLSSLFHVVERDISSGFKHWRFLFSDIRSYAFEYTFAFVRFFGADHTQLQPKRHAASSSWCDPETNDGLRKAAELVEWQDTELESFCVGCRRSFARYPRASLLFQFPEAQCVTEYEIGGDAMYVNLTPTGWSLYATDDEQAACHYQMNGDRLATKSDEEQRAWTLLHTHTVERPATQTSESLGKFSIQTTQTPSTSSNEEKTGKEKDGPHGDASSNSTHAASHSDEKPSDGDGLSGSGRAFRYYRLDIYPSFELNPLRAVALSAIRFLDSGGSRLIPSRWSNPRFVLPSDSVTKSSLDALNQVDAHGMDSFFIDGAIGVEGVSELIASFSMPVEVHAYEFARWIGSSDTMSPFKFHHDPRSWILQASNDRDTWTTMHVVQDAIYNQRDKQVYNDEPLHLLAPLPNTMPHPRSKEFSNMPYIPSSTLADAEAFASISDSPPADASSSGVNDFPLFLRHLHHHPILLKPYTSPCSTICMVCDGECSMGVKLYQCEACGWYAHGECVLPSALSPPTEEILMSMTMSMAARERQRRHQDAQDAAAAYTAAGGRVRGGGVDVDDDEVPPDPCGPDVIQASPHGYISPAVKNWGLKNMPRIWCDVRGMGFRNDYARFVTSKQYKQYINLNDDDPTNDDEDDFDEEDEEDIWLSVAIKGKRSEYTAKGVYILVDGQVKKGPNYTEGVELEQGLGKKVEDEAPPDVEDSVGNAELSVVDPVQQGDSGSAINVVDDANPSPASLEIPSSTNCWWYFLLDAWSDEHLAAIPEEDPLIKQILDNQMDTAKRALAENEREQAKLQRILWSKRQVVKPPADNDHANAHANANRPYQLHRQRRHGQERWNGGRDFGAMTWLQHVDEHGLYHSNAADIVQPNDTDIQIQTLSYQHSQTQGERQAIIQACEKMIPLSQQLAVAPPSLLSRVRELFLPDGSGLTPRDYGLTLPTLRIIRHWERALGLSPLGIDAIVVFAQPRLIETDVFEQAFKSAAHACWRIIACRGKKETDEEEMKKQAFMEKKMKEVAESLEKQGLAVEIYEGDDTCDGEDDEDKTKMLLISAAYSRLLLESSSRALEDDRQYDSFRRLASSVTLPAELRHDPHLHRAPFTSAQRQALVMRILSGLGTSLKHVTDMQKAVQERNVKSEAIKVAEALKALRAAVAYQQQERRKKSQSQTAQGGVMLSPSRPVSAKARARSRRPSVVLSTNRSQRSQMKTLNDAALPQVDDDGAMENTGLMVPHRSFRPSRNHSRANSHAVSAQVNEYSRSRAPVAEPTNQVKSSGVMDPSVDEVKSLLSAAASFNVLQLVARGEVHAISLMHSEKEKKMIEHAWRHMYISTAEKNDRAWRRQRRRLAEEIGLSEAMLLGEKDEQQVAFEPPKKDEERWLAPMTQPFTREAIRFALREGEHVIRGFTALSLLRSYAGDRVAFFFAFVSYTLLWQFILFLPGLVLTIIALLYGSNNAALPWNSLLVMCWSTVCIDRWHRKSSELAYTYNTLGMQQTEACRPQFKGWTVTMTRKAYNKRKREFEEKVAETQQRRFEKMQRRGIVPSHPLPPPPAFDPAYLLLPSWLFDLEWWVQESLTGAMKVSCRVEPAVVPVQTPSRVQRWWSKLKAKCNCTRRTNKVAPDENETNAATNTPAHAHTHAHAPIPADTQLDTLEQRQMRDAGANVYAGEDNDKGIVHLIAQRTNPITSAVEDFYPLTLYGVKLFVTSILTLAWVAGVIAWNLLLLELKDAQYSPSENFTTYWPAAIGVISGASMKIFHTLYNIYTDFVLNWENHRTQYAFSNAKIIKVFSFAFVNSYFALFYLSLTADPDDAAAELATQLVSIMLSRTLTGLLLDDALPYVIFVMTKRKLRKEREARFTTMIANKAATSAASQSSQPASAQHSPRRTAMVHDIAQSATSTMPQTQTDIVHDGKTANGTVRPQSGAVAQSSASSPLRPESRVIVTEGTNDSTAAVSIIRIDPPKRKAAWTGSATEDMDGKLSTDDRKQSEPDASVDQCATPSQQDGAGEAEEPRPTAATSPSQLPPTDQHRIDMSLVAPSMEEHQPSSGAILPSSAPLSTSDSSTSSSSITYQLGTESSLNSIQFGAELEIQRPTSPSLLDQYLEIITQIGYVTCFSAVFPAAPLLVIGSLALNGHGLLHKYIHIAQRPIQERAADIGAWVSILTFLSFVSIITNCVLIFHTSLQWRSYSSSNRDLSMLVFGLTLFIIKVLLMSIIPDQAGWVTTRLLAVKYESDQAAAHTINTRQAEEAIKIERKQYQNRVNKLQDGANVARLQAKITEREDSMSTLTRRRTNTNI